MYPILLVEDNPDDAELIKRALRDSGNLNEIVWLMCGETSIEWLRKNTPLLIILDMKLTGGMDGVDVLRALRGMPRLTRLGVIIFSESQAKRDQIEAFRLGANVYIKKTDDFSNLLEAIKLLQMHWAIMPHQGD